MSTEQNQRKRRKILPWLFLTLVLVIGIGYGSWRYILPNLAVGQPAQEAGGQTKTTTVRRSDLTVSISGSGTVITALSVDLAFPVEGTLGALSVAPGDQVKKGQVLAILRDTAALEQAVLDRQLAVQVAQKALDDLQSNASLELAQAQADQATAEQAYVEAKASAHAKGDARCSASKTQEYYFQYINAQKKVDVWQARLDDPHTGYGRDFILENLAPLQKERDQAYGNYTYCQGYTDKEIQASQSNLQLSSAKLDLAITNYENMKSNAGIDPIALAIARADLNNARLQLAKAQNDLAGVTITAPIDGTVTAVNGKVGGAVGTGAFITLADLEQPQVQVYVDETDLANFAAGCPAVVTFDSLPGQTFEGEVSQVSPSLVSYNNANMVQGLVELRNKETSAGKTLQVGLSASVEVTCHQAKNALIVPAQALYEPEGQPAYVYLVNGAGQPEKREVGVGLKTIASAEITSGLTEGEKIITSQIEGK